MKATDLTLTRAAAVWSAHCRSSAVAALLILVAAAAPALAQSPARDLNQLSIEELMNIEITSASRKEQRVEDIAAAVFVITHDDIRRSGMTTVPDLLRLAPGVNVAQFNGSNWAVSVRGFNDLFANKLLVLVDGRSVYSWIFSGVSWDAEDMLVDDIERIEVIRGPGAAIWGANAVNGVINIVTKSATDTQGGLVSVEAGGWGQQGAVRYGGRIGSANYRVHTQWTGRDPSLIEAGREADDAFWSTTSGFRADWSARASVFMLDGKVTVGRSHPLWSNLDPLTAAQEPISGDRSDAQSGHVLGRWTLKRPGGSSLQVQSFFDIAARQEPIADYQRRTFDVDTQYHTSLGAHDFVTGFGYRFNADRYGGRGGFSLAPPVDHGSRVTAFLQDEIALFGDRLALSFGSQVQYDSDAGAGLQPNARVMWKLRPGQRLWGAVSRALRTPSRYERGILVAFPPVPTEAGLPLTVNVVGNPEIDTETFVDAETGYRLEIGTKAGMSATMFVGRYAHLQTQEAGAPALRFDPAPALYVTTTFGNLLEATTHGLEAAGYWSPAPAWRLDASYTALRVTPHLAATSQDLQAELRAGSAPRRQWQLRSTFMPGPRTTIGVALFHVGPLDLLQVPGYTRADVNAEWRLSEHLSAMVLGQNLLDPAHPEFATAGGLNIATQVPRSVSLRLRWTFK